MEKERERLEKKLLKANEAYEFYGKLSKASHETYASVSNKYSLSRQEAMLWPKAVIGEGLANLPTPIAIAQSDVDGKFELVCPIVNAPISLVACATRTTAVREEHYYWIVTNILKTEGKLDLNNENLVTGRHSSVGIPDLDIDNAAFPQASDIKSSE